MQFKYRFTCKMISNSFHQSLLFININAVSDLTIILLLFIFTNLEIRNFNNYIINKDVIWNYIPKNSLDRLFHSLLILKYWIVFLASCHRPLFSLFWSKVVSVIQSSLCIHFILIIMLLDIPVLIQHQCVVILHLYVWIQWWISKDSIPHM